MSLPAIFLWPPWVILLPKFCHQLFSRRPSTNYYYNFQRFFTTHLTKSLWSYIIKFSFFFQISYHQPNKTCKRNFWSAPRNNQINQTDVNVVSFLTWLVQSYCPIHIIPWILVQKWQRQNISLKKIYFGQLCYLPKSRVDNFWIHSLPF